MENNPLPILNQPTPGFPCATCHSECCSGIPLLASEFREIIAHLRSMSRRELKRLANQRRDPTTCLFVDTDAWRCSIYPVRPWLCRIFGKIPRLVCAYAPERQHDESQEDSDATVTRMLLTERVVRLTAFNPVGFDIAPVLHWPELLQQIKGEQK